MALIPLLCNNNNLANSYQWSWWLLTFIKYLPCVRHGARYSLHIIWWSKYYYYPQFTNKIPFYLFPFFETISLYVVQACLRLTILPSQPLKFWDYRCVLPGPGKITFKRQKLLEQYIHMLNSKEELEMWSSLAC